MIDARVSDPKQLQGNGLDDQKIICDNFVRAKGWNTVKSFLKSHSGRKIERGDFEETIEYIKVQNRKGIQIHYYVVKSIDRFTRNGAVTYDEMKGRLGDLGVQLIDAYGIIQPQQNTLQHLGLEYEWSKYSPSEGSELMEATRGKSEVRDILTRMVSAEVTLTRRGLSMRAPNDGYINVKKIIDGKAQSVVQQDPERSRYYKEIYELRGMGTYSDKEIVDKINALGFRSRPQKRWKTEGKDKRIIGHSQPKKLTVKQLQKLILRTMYAGIKYETWNGSTPIWAVFSDSSEPIVSIKVFNDANKGKVFIRVKENNELEVLYNYNQKERGIQTRRKYHPDYSYDKMILCSVCNKPYKNSGKGNTGKSGNGFQAYHCDRMVNGVKHYQRIPQKEYESSVTKLLNSLRFTKDFEKKLEVQLLKKYREKEQEVLSTSIKVGTNVTELKVEQEALLRNFHLINSSLVREKTEQQIEELQKEIDSATEERDKVEIKERDIKSFVRYAKDLVEHPAKMLADNRNPVKQHALFELVFDTLPTYAEIVNGTPKLSLLFKVSEEFKTGDSMLVTLRGIEPRLQE